jgi:glycosyltransferase involved in cell wall biosynthesis
MDFAKTRVLVDGRELALPYNTGVKTYGWTLLAALQRLGMSPDILASAHFHGDPLVARARVRDVPIHHIPDMDPKAEKWRHRLRRPRTAQHMSWQGAPPLPGSDNLFPFGRDCSVLPFVYEHAQAIQEQLFFPMRFRTRQTYDIWHATVPLPLIPVGMRTITTIHDLIPLLLPQTCFLDRGAFSAQVRLAIRQSSAIAAVSEHTKRDLLTYFDAPEEKIVVTYQPTLLENWAGREPLRTRLLQVLDLKPQGYLLFVGNLEPKKNVGRLIRAYLEMDCDLPLVIAGRKAWQWEDDLAPLASLTEAASRRIRLLGHVNDEWLPYLYESAYCTVFPSLYEGFGLPLLEAMTLGCPVVCSRNSSLPEVGGEAAEYVDPLDTGSIARGLERLLNDRPHRDALARKGREQARRFSMDAYVAKLAQLYEKALT